MPGVLSNLLPSSFFSKKEATVKPDSSSSDGFVNDKSDNLPQSNRRDKEREMKPLQKTHVSNGKLNVACIETMVIDTSAY